MKTTDYITKELSQKISERAKEEGVVLPESEYHWVKFIINGNVSWYLREASRESLELNSESKHSEAPKDYVPAFSYYSLLTTHVRFFFGEEGDKICILCEENMKKDEWSTYCDCVDVGLNYDYKIRNYRHYSEHLLSLLQQGKRAEAESYFEANALLFNSK